MKVREGFVSNSSTTSFMHYVHRKDDVGAFDKLMREALRGNKDLFDECGLLELPGPFHDKSRSYRYQKVPPTAYDNLPRSVSGSLRAVLGTGTFKRLLGAAYETYFDPVKKAAQDAKIATHIARGRSL